MRTTRPITIASLSGLAVGTGLTVVAFVALPWFRAGNGPYAPPDGGPVPRTFGELRAHYDIAGTGYAAHQYFTWFSWTLLGVLLFLGVIRSAGLPVFAGRWQAVGFGVIGAYSTKYAMAGVDSGDSLTNHAEIGVWVAMAGYVLTGLAAALPATTRPSRAGTPDGRTRLRPAAPGR